MNADVFAELMQSKSQYPSAISELFRSVEKASSVYDLDYLDLIHLYAFLPNDYWDGRIMSVTNLFQSKPNTNQ
jgi:hypothetical protein